MFSIYIHIPYCQRVCPYCDFAVSGARPRPEEAYVEALLLELGQAATQAPWRAETADTVYFGGGTPSLFAPRSIARVMTRIRELWAMHPAPEMTLEANPDDVSPASAKGFREAGINRLSLGLQSLQPAHLARLGRQHTAETSLAAVGAARGAGFDNLNLDLMFAVPGQTAADWEADLRAACGLAPEHLSLYGLTYEPRTRFTVWRDQGRLAPVAEPVEVAMYTLAAGVLSATGYRRYEISNYARPGYESRHNSNYWRGVDYLGAGAGAHSFTAQGWGKRWANDRHPKRYMAAVAERGTAQVFSETLTRRQAITEFVFLALRQRRGLQLSAFATRFGAEFEEAFPHVGELCARDLLERTTEGYRLSDAALLVSDSVFETFA